MTGFLSLPSELLSAIIETCAGRERCRLRATCKVLNEHADPIVFRRLCLYRKDDSPYITEHQIISLATRSSKACEFARDLEICQMWNSPQASEHGDDLRVHLPTAISFMRHLTRFRWAISRDSDWLIDPLLQVVARLPQLADLEICAMYDSIKTRIPFGQFANLSRLSVWYDWHEHVSFFISEMATAIANSPQLITLNVNYTGPTDDGGPLPTLSALFAKIPTKNPLFLKHLRIKLIDATIDQTTLLHLVHLKSFQVLLFNENRRISQSVWTSFLNSNIKLSNVVIRGCITEEAMSYLSSFSGLKRFIVNFHNTIITEEFEKMLFEAVLPKHAESLQKLWITNTGLVKWFFNCTNSKSIMNCLKLHDLHVQINGKEGSMSVQLLLDTVARLPKLKILRFSVRDIQARDEWVESFKPSPGLRYVEEVEIGCRRYVLEKDGGQQVKYRKIN